MTRSFTREDFARQSFDVDDTAAVMTKIGAALATPTELADHVQLVVVPDGFDAKVVDTSHLLESPRRKNASRSFHDIFSFIEYVNRHSVEGHTSAYVSSTTGGCSAIAVIDDHGDNKPGHRDHTARLVLSEGTALKAWISNDSRSMDQICFAEFLEDNAADIIEPDAATLLEVVSTLQAANKAAFESAVRLDNGAVQIMYREEITATAGKAASLEIPQVFSIAVQVFEHGARYKIDARLRYRIREGKLALSYRLERMHDIVHNALVGGETSVLNELDAKLDGIPVYFGEA